jgi:uncharacterized protein involved in exopolysaccharide biosynthesis
MAVFFGSVMALVVVFTLLSARAYRSMAKLFVRLGRENATLDPTATFGQTPVVALPPTRENEINSVVEILRTRALLEEVVDRVGPAALLGEGDPLPPSKQPFVPREERETASSSRTRTPQQEKALRLLSKQLGVEAVKKSNIVQVTYEGPSPEIAEDVIAALVDAYLERHAQFNRTPRVHQFLAEQAAQAKSQLARSERQLRDLQVETGLFSPDTQKQMTVARVGRLEDELLQTTSALSAAEAELDTLKKKLAGVSETQETARTRGVANQGTDNMRAQLYTLQLKELELLARNPPESPEVILIRQQVKAARELLALEERSLEQVTTGPNRVHEEARLAVLKQEPVVAALRSKSASIRSQLEAERKVLKTLNDNMLRVVELQRTVDLQTSLHRRYSENLAQTQVDRALEVEKISNISVVQPATYDPDPVRPRKLINLAVGLFLAVCGSLALAWLSESWNRPLENSPTDAVMSERRAVSPSCRAASVEGSSRRAGEDHVGLAPGSPIVSDA